MNFIKRLLRFLRITDEQNDISISQLLPIVTGLYALVGDVIAQGRSGDWENVGLFAVAVLLYGSKRWRQNRPETDARIRELEQQLDELTRGA